ncbi:MAG: DctP family TRAP transporter solute-binding subunit, partial [Nocardioidaceae bacterium]
MNRSKTMLLLVSALTTCLAVASCSRGAGQQSGDATYTIKFSHVVTPNTPKGKAAEKFKEIVEEESGGDITVEIFPNSELYGDEDELQALQSGAVQMLAPAGAKFSTIAPQLQVLDLPFLFDSVDEIPEVFSPDTVVGKAIYENEDLAKRDIKVLGLWDNGLKHLSSNRPMHSPADLKGLKFRIQPSDVLRSQIEAWGGQATPMAFAEVYSALQQGVIDAQENTYSSIESQNMYSVQSHMTETYHGYVGYILVINKKFLDGLTEDQQKIVTDAADEASAYNREIAEDVNAHSKEVITESGETTITELSDAERQAFKDAVVPSVWEQYADVVGQDLLDELLA